jgi:hypothetical protein
MSVSDLIKNAMDKDAGSFESSFNGIMADKMTAAIGQKYDSMFGAPAEAGEPVEAEASVEVESE